jgi:hypothetical protein
VRTRHAAVTRDPYNMARYTKARCKSCVETVICSIYIVMRKDFTVECGFLHFRPPCLLVDAHNGAYLSGSSYSSPSQHVATDNTSVNNYGLLLIYIYFKTSAWPLK